MTNKTNYTPSQQRAIDEQGHNILVSASAGSGKTSVLVERVIQKILNGTGIDELLIVTFTNAAAKGMRDRIAGALRDKIRDENTNLELKQRLKKQLNQVGVANISTIDAFCLQFLKRYYYIIDLDPQYRILADQAEVILLREQVFGEVAEDFYAQQDERFEKLVQNFSNDHDDAGLADVVEALDTFANATPDPKRWLDQLVKSYEVADQPLVKTAIYQDELLQILKNVIQQVQGDLSQAIELCVQDSFDKVRAVLNDELFQAQEVADLIDHGTWNEIRARLINLNFATLRMPKADEDQEVAVAVKELRNSSKEALKGLSDYFVLPEEETKQAMGGAAHIVSTLVNVTWAFRAAYQAEKSRRHLIDFSDAEHFALDILTSDTEEGQAVVAQLAEQFKEVMVDEYQDTNQLQESILQQIVSHETGNMFMVGDVKQSIYKFRQADPQLFMTKYQKYRQSDDADQAIVLAENFRSVKNVTEFTNLIFEQLMDQTVGEMDYDDAAHLKYGASYYGDSDQETEILLYESDGDETPEAAGFDLDDKNAGEVQMIGRRILEMVQNQEPIYDKGSKTTRPVNFGDVTILASTRNNNTLIMDQFSRLNIPVTVSDAQNYFQATEVRIMMSLLRVIDNPYQDIPLVAVLRSPMVGLDENQLAYLRIQDKTDDYFVALKTFHDHFAAQDEYAEELYSRVDRFLRQLDRFKSLANQNRLVALIWDIYEQTGFLDYVGGMPGGVQRQANLHALYQRAYDYEQSSFKGLFQFVRFIEQMQKQDQDLGQAPTSQDNNTVKVMTIHGSKGLEFSVVFLMGATHGFNMGALKQNYILESHKGLGINYLTDDRVSIETLQKQVLKNEVDKNIKAEQMRLLYVALTRAEQKLVITGSYPNREKAVQNWEKAFQTDHLVLPNQLRLDKSNFMDWIGMSIVRHPSFDQNFLTGDNWSDVLTGNQAKFTLTWRSANDLASETTDTQQAVVSGKQILETSVDDLPVGIKDKINQVLEFSYPHTASTKTTAYQSVSEIKRLFEDPDNSLLGQLTFSPEAQDSGRYVNSEFGQPKFMQTAVQPKATEIGTATHLVLQMLDVRQPISLTEIQQQITRLTSSNLISPDVADKINRQEIMAFFATEFGQTVINKPNSWHREVPFSMLIDGQQLFKGITTAEEKILIHGIIDGYLVQGDEIQLVDYKTDWIAGRNDQDSINRVIDRYRGQVNLYSRAVEQMTGHNVTHKYLYLMSIESLVELN